MSYYISAGLPVFYRMLKIYAAYVPEKVLIYIQGESNHGDQGEEGHVWEPDQIADSLLP